MTENGQLYLSNGHARLPLSGQPAALASRLASGSVVLGVRPEHVRPVPAGELALKVELVETLGSQKFIHGLAEGWPQLTVSVDPASRPATDDVIQLALAPDKLHFFDRATGARLHANAGV